MSRAVDPALAVTPPRAAPVPALVYASGATVPASGGGPTVQRSAASGGVPLSALPIATASWVNPAVVQRVEVVEAHAPRPVVVQREDAAPAADSAPSAAPVEAASTPPAAAPAPGGDAESLLAKLFDPLLSRLKTELRLDRERRGNLTDLWH